MDAEQRQQLIRAAESIAEMFGSNLYQFCGSLAQLHDRVRPSLEHMRSRAAIDAFLAGQPDIEEETFQIVLSILLVAPKLIEDALQVHIKMLADSFPSNPPGPPRKLTPELSRAVVQYVSELHKKGVQLRTAQERAARQFNIGLRSAQRAWRNRETLAKSPILSLNDILKFLGKA